MSAESWQADNNRYLAATLQWLRLLLQRLAPEDPSAAPGPSARHRHGLFRRWQAGCASAPGQTRGPADPQGPPLDERIKEAAAA